MKVTGVQRRRPGGDGDHLVGERRDPGDEHDPGAPGVVAPGELGELLGIAVRGRAPRCRRSRTGRSRSHSPPARRAPRTRWRPARSARRASGRPGSSARSGHRRDREDRAFGERDPGQHRHGVALGGLSERPVVERADHGGAAIEGGEGCLRLAGGGRPVPARGRGYAVRAAGRPATGARGGPAGRPKTAGLREIDRPPATAMMRAVGDPTDRRPTPRAPVAESVERGRLKICFPQGSGSSSLPGGTSALFAGEASGPRKGGGGETGPARRLGPALSLALARETAPRRRGAGTGLPVCASSAMPSRGHARRRRAKGRSCRPQTNDLNYPFTIIWYSGCGPGMGLAACRCLLSYGEEYIISSIWKGGHGLSGRASRLAQRRERMIVQRRASVIGAAAGALMTGGSPRRAGRWRRRKAKCRPPGHPARRRWPRPCRSDGSPRHRRSPVRSMNGCARRRTGTGRRSLDQVAREAQARPDLADAIGRQAAQLRPDLAQAATRVAGSAGTGGATGGATGGGLGSLAGAAVVGVGAAGAAVAVGGGGGGGGDGGGGTPAPAPTPGDFETVEYAAGGGLGAINASTAYARGADGSGVIVGVLDSGIDPDHPDFAGRIAPRRLQFRRRLDRCGGHRLGQPRHPCRGHRRRQPQRHGHARRRPWRSGPAAEDLRQHVVHDQRRPDRDGDRPCRRPGGAGAQQQLGVGPDDRGRGAGVHGREPCGHGGCGPAADRPGRRPGLGGRQCRTRRPVGPGGTAARLRRSRGTVAGRGQRRPGRVDDLRLQQPLRHRGDLVRGGAGSRDRLDRQPGDPGRQPVPEPNRHLHGRPARRRGPSPC